ncbi:hypothetical protein Tco_0432937 [Tanacetum coccineum]
MTTSCHSLRGNWASIEEYYDENVDHMDQTNKLVKETMKTLDNISKVDSALKEDMKKMAKSYNTSSGNLSGMVTEMLQAFKGMSSSTLSVSASISTAPQPEVRTSVVGENLEKQKPKDEAAETPIEQEPERPTRAFPISTVRPITRPNPEVALIESSSRPLLTGPIIEILEKGIVIGDEESPQKPMPASTVDRQDPDEPIRIPNEIHGKIYNLTDDEIQEYLNKKEEIKKKA